VAKLTHVVWDWNGTLVDDLPVVVEAVNYALAGLEADPIDAGIYRDLYVRPVILFYERLLERTPLPAEWDLIDGRFHERYAASLGRVPLTADALTAIERVGEKGWSQSILSMWWHEELLPFVEAKGIHDSMSSIQGNRHDAGAGKAVHLAEHVARLGYEPGEVTMIGDALDDAVAAREVGTECVLYDGGSHHRAELEAAGMPVASSLVEAVEIATGSS
jgi:phosphoglycolate phosphatase-like HAD superfamily hydrolase